MIYFIEAVGLDRVKIGTSRDPQDRLSHLTCAMPCEVRLLKTLEGGHAEEHALHRRFHAHRTKGEWFVLSAIRADMEAITEATSTVEAYRTCPRCGAARRSKDGRYRGLLCRGCGAKDAGERKRSVREEADAKRCVCVDCGVAVAASAVYKAGTRPTNDGALRCRPCGMKHAWAHPAYREKIMAARASRRKLCPVCGKDGVGRHATYHPVCWEAARIAPTGDSFDHPGGLAGSRGKLQTIPENGDATRLHHGKAASR